MRLHVEYPEKYSRGELLLRTFFGIFYIFLPHAIVLLFVGIWAAILNLLAFFSIIFTGRYPENWFKFQVGFMRWNLRLQMRLYNIADDYPKFGIDVEDPKLKFSVPYPENLSKGHALLKFFLAWIYVGLPHGIILSFIGLAVQFIVFLNFWIVLFTGQMPKGLFDFIVGMMRWSTRVSVYLNYMTDTYPAFSLEETPEESMEKFEGEGPDEPLYEGIEIID
jgi:hypothetical protein